MLPRQFKKVKLLHKFMQYFFELESFLLFFNITALIFQGLTNNISFLEVFMGGSSSPIRSGSPSSVQDFYAVAQRLSGDEKGKEEEDGDVGLESQALPF